jgi:hypothetical protein
MGFKMFEDVSVVDSVSVVFFFVVSAGFDQGCVVGLLVFRSCVGIVFLAFVFFLAWFRFLGFVTGLFRLLIVIRVLAFFVPLFCVFLFGWGSFKCFSFCS